MEIKVETPVFEGPLDLLIYLIRKKELSIYDISVSELTEEFLNYVKSVGSLDISFVAEFLYMASILAKIKSECLIPKEEEKKEANKKLLNFIEAYLKSKKAAEILEKLEDEASKSFTHDPSELLFKLQDRIKIANTVYDLKKAYEDVLKRKFQNKSGGIRIRVSEETFKVSDKMEEIRFLIKERPVIKFSELIERSCSKLELITYFLAILELSRLGEISTSGEGEDLIICKLYPVKTKEEEPILSF
jgi:segregation and condensation protein A